MHTTAKALATQGGILAAQRDFTGMDVEAMFGDPGLPRTNFDMVQAAADRRNQATPNTDIAAAARGLARIIATSGSPERARANAIDSFIATLDIELRAIANRDLAAIARSAGL